MTQQVHIASEAILSAMHCDVALLSGYAADNHLYANSGVKLKLSDRQAPQVAIFFAPECDDVETTFGPLPERWQANMARM